jgi:hypothetical protein
MSATSTAPGDVVPEADERFLFEAEEWHEEVHEDPNQPHKLGMKSYGRDLADGLDGGPWAREVIFPAGFENVAHFHTAPQFQIMLEGSVSFPTHELTAPAVHYADALSPYGPFTVGEGFKIMVVRPWKAKKYNMYDRENRGKRNPYGRNMYGQSRELYGQADDSAWTRTESGYESQHLFGTPTSEGLDGPMAELVRLGTGGSITNDAIITEFGLFVIVFAGEISVRDKKITPYSTYFSRGVHDEAMVAGPEGATVLRLAFDNAAHPSQRSVVSV